MTVHIVEMTDAECRIPTVDEAGLGALTTERGNLPLKAVDATVTITGLVSRTELTQTFQNNHDTVIEATYIFPLPDRGAVTAMRMTAAGRVVDAEIQERGVARAQYDQAIAAGKRAAIAEEERPDVFTMRVGNIPPQETVEIRLTFITPLPYEDGEATYRLPLVVAPRYIPGKPLATTASGVGYADDTDAVPDASRITPPILLPGFPNPIRLGIEVDIDPAGLTLGEVRSSLHTVVTEGNHLRIMPGERANRDFILRLTYGEPEAASRSLTLTPDNEGGEGTFRLTVVPPTATVVENPRDVILLLDRSGSMEGWKMVAARRAAARIVDTLTGADRFAVLTFDDQVETPPNVDPGLIPGTDRNRFRSIEHLATVDARGGTELLEPLQHALALLSTKDDSGRTRDQVIVLVTDGQVGDEDEILAEIGKSLTSIRVHTVGIDEAVNAGFLGRLATVGRGRCELVESEDRLDVAMDRIHRRIGASLVTGVSLNGDLQIIPDTISPARMPDIFPGVPLVVSGRYVVGAIPGSLSLAGTTRQGTPWSVQADGQVVENPALTAVWARGHLRDLEDRYAMGEEDTRTLAPRIVAASLRFGVLCRFTAWLAVDKRIAVERGGRTQIVQPVDLPSGWVMPDMDMMSSAVLDAEAAENAPGQPMPVMRRRPRPAPIAPQPGSPMVTPTMTSTPPMMAKRSVGGVLKDLFSPAAPSVTPSVRESVAPMVAAPAPASFASHVTVNEGESEWRTDSTTYVTEAKVSVREELERLRTAATEPAFRRRELLADLGSRLAALVRHLRDNYVDPAALGPIADLLIELEDDRPMTFSDAELDTVWHKVVALFTAFTEN